MRFSRILNFICSLYKQSDHSLTLWVRYNREYHPVTVTGDYSRLPVPYFQVNPLQLIWRSGIPLDSIYGCVNYACPSMLTSKWHQNSALLTLCEGNSRCPVVSLHKGQWCGIISVLWRYYGGTVTSRAAWRPSDCACVFWSWCTIQSVFICWALPFAELDKGYGHNHLLIFLTPETIHYFACIWRVICRHLNL